MSLGVKTAEPDSAERHRLRVAIVSNDAVRRAGLDAMVRTAGHEVVSDAAQADVVLADGDLHPTHPAVVSLGGGSDAAGILSHDPDPAQIDAALRAVAAGLTVRAPGEGFGPVVEREPDVLLTPREMEVLSAIAEGLSNKAIARKLEISQHTVKFHVESLFRKLAVRSRAEAIMKSIDLLRSRVEL
jgi:DNA-binding NarL/FixJ family response regulator